MATSQPLGFMARDIASATVATSIALYYSWKLTLVLSLSVPSAAVGLGLISRPLPSAIEAQKRKLNEASKYTNTAFKAIDTVKVFNGQHHEIRQYSSVIDAAGKYFLVQAHVNSLQMGTMRFLVVIMFMAGFWYGLFLYREGELTPGNVITTFYSFLMGNQAVGSLLSQWLVLSNGKSSGEKLDQIVGELDDNDKFTKIAGSRILESCEGDIVVSNVSFKLSILGTRANLHSLHSRTHQIRLSWHLSILTYSSPLERQHAYLDEVALGRAH